MNRIILLDIDGVLVQPRGYRAALRATVQRFVGEYPIEEDLLTELEKRGISSEWDMSPLIIAAYWDDVLSRQPMSGLSDDVAVAAKQIQSQRMDVPKRLSIPEFELVAGQYPAETAFRAGCFTSIPEALRKNLLTESRNVRKSETFRAFQHFTLGSKNYEATYQLSPEFETQSLLRTEDKANISTEIGERLRHPMNSLAAFTARPSHPPRGVETSVGYAPEAELALELVGMADIPLMAFGKLEYIAAQHGLDPAVLIKPSPFQALAGMLAAWTGDELSALRAAHDWHVSGKLNSRFDELPQSFELVVVEDTMGGIRSTWAAGEILQKAGFDVTVRAFGLTSGIAAKAAAFTAADVPHFENWESLMGCAGL
ncbi:MAG TPA: hypothetical protein PLF42_00810 [Anaerolineales bacterium]|nr:hypothetical protein [Anaerolineales bacterium]